MPEEPNLPNQPTPSEPASEWTDAEWSDDSGYEALEEPAEAEEEPTASSVDDWDTASMDWEADINEPPDAIPQAPTTREALAWIQPIWRRSLRVWRRLIAGLRNRIPAAAQFSDTVLTAILVGILVVLLVLLNGVRQPSAARSQPPIAPSVPLGEAPSATDSPTGASRPEPDEAAPQVPAPTTPAEPTAAPPVSDRIAQIQAQMTDSSILNAQRVIDSVQADLVNDRLTLVLNGDWYRLSDYDQTQLAEALMAQSQALSFTDLQFQTSAGEVIARSPVVGKQMVILQRERPPQVPMPERPRFRIMIDR